MTRHFDDQGRAREAGRRGGIERARRLRAARGQVEPYAGPFLDFLDATGRSGPTRIVWRVFWKVADGLPLEPDEVAIYRRHTARETPPTAPARECWLPAGRRGGKSENMTALTGQYDFTLAFESEPYETEAPETERVGARRGFVGYLLASQRPGDLVSRAGHAAA